MRTETRETARRVMWFVALWAAGVLVFAAVTLLFKALT